MSIRMHSTIVFFVILDCEYVEFSSIISFTTQPESLKPTKLERNFQILCDLTIFCVIHSYHADFILLPQLIFVGNFGDNII